MGTNLFVILIRLPEFCVIKHSQVEEDKSREEINSLKKKIQQLLDILEANGISISDYTSTSAVSSTNDIEATDTDPGEWWDDNDLMKKLKISLSTINRRRKDGTFKFFRIGGRYHYIPKDIMKIRDRFMK